MIDEMQIAPRILLVDDDEKFRRVLSLRLESEGYDVVPAADAEQAYRCLDEMCPDFIVTDLRMPGADGIALLEEVQLRKPGMPIAILSAHGDITDAVRATQSGAVDFLVKPVSGEQLLACIRRHVQSHEGSQSAAMQAWAPGFITRSARMMEVLADARRVARLDSSVLLSGPSGSGKEVLARAIHDVSPRSSKPFVAINCAAVPAELLESELFGHRRGAFTGAHSDHRGLFRAAEGGTVFLDEIGDMPEPLQAKLLRVLQEREVRPVGDVQAIAVDVRVLSATHRDLEARVADGSFREDLFYRLNVVQLRLPPLADRREDIPLLVALRLAQLAEAGGPRRVFAPDAMELLLGAPWPGNVRQLFNLVEQTAVLSSSRVIASPLVRKALGVEETTMMSLDEAREQFMRSYLLQILRLAEHNVSRAARLAGRNRTDFYKLLRRYGVSPSPQAG